MRHRVYGKHLGRDKDQRDLLFKGLIQAIFTRGSIQTTEAKAKAIKGLIDKTITQAKKSNVYQLGLTKETLSKLGGRTSGYISMVKMGRRVGDQSMLVKMSLIGAEEIKPVAKKSEPVKKVEEEKVTPKKEVAIKKSTPKKKVVAKKK